MPDANMGDSLLNSSNQNKYGMLMVLNPNIVITGPNQMLDRINYCISLAYCKAKELKCVGRDVKENNLLLKKLILAKFLAQNGEGGVLSCFMEINCNC